MSTSAGGLVGRGQAYVKTPEFTKLWRYCAVSGISTFLSLFCLFVFYRVVGLEAVWANVVATCIATVPSYYLNRSWAWGKSGKSHLMKEVVPFWVIAFLSLVLSSLAVSFANHESSGIHSKDEKSLILLFANFVTYGTLWVVKYSFFNRVLFRHRQPTSGSGEGGAESEAPLSVAG